MLSTTQLICIPRKSEQRRQVEMSGFLVPFESVRWTPNCHWSRVIERFYNPPLLPVINSFVIRVLLDEGMNINDNHPSVCFDWEDKTTMRLLCSAKMSSTLHYQRFYSFRVCLEMAVACLQAGFFKIMSYHFHRIHFLFKVFYLKYACGI